MDIIQVFIELYEQIRIDLMSNKDVDYTAIDLITLEDIKSALQNYNFNHRYEKWIEEGILYNELICFYCGNKVDPSEYGYNCDCGENSTVYLCEECHEIIPLNSFEFDDNDQEHKEIMEHHLMNDKMNLIKNSGYNPMLENVTYIYKCKCGKTFKKQMD